MSAEHRRLPNQEVVGLGKKVDSLRDKIIFGSGDENTFGEYIGVLGMIAESQLRAILDNKTLKRKNKKRRDDVTRETISEYSRVVQIASKPDSWSSYCKNEAEDALQRAVEIEPDQVVLSELLFEEALNLEKMASLLASAEKFRL
ncbi:MAG: hypothetical protein ABIO02_00165 [Patescibacteria group bacterium]